MGDDDEKKSTAIYRERLYHEVTKAKRSVQNMSKATGQGSFSSPRATRACSWRPLAMRLVLDTVRFWPASGCSRIWLRDASFKEPSPRHRLLFACEYSIATGRCIERRLGVRRDGRSGGA